MKVFISWSGEASKAIAEILRGWIPSVIQAAKPYFSPDDISKGSRWNSEIANELQECSVGLICLTSENLEAPWIMFEAGALSKSISISKVCPLLFGIDPSEVKGPLVQFQAAPFTKTEMKKTVKMMNELLGSESLGSDVLDDVFEMFWPKLEEKVKKVLADLEIPKKKKIRSDRDIIEEILNRVRVPPQDRMTLPSDHPAFSHLYRTAIMLGNEIFSEDSSTSNSLSGKFMQMWEPLTYIINHMQVRRSDLFEDSLEKALMSKSRLWSRAEKSTAEILGLVHKADQPDPQKSKSRSPKTDTK